MKKVNLLEDSIGSLAVRYMIPSVLGNAWVIYVYIF